MVTEQRSQAAPGLAEGNLQPGPRQLLYAAYAWSLFMLLAPPLWLGIVLLPRMDWRWALVRRASRLLLGLLGIPLTVRDEGRLGHCPPCVITPNHASYTDSMILVAALACRFVFTPTRAFERHFFSRVFMARLGSLFVGGKGGDAERLAAVVREGRSVIVFPEGAVHPTPGIRPFRTGAFVAATVAGAPVLPVVIRGSRRLFRHKSWLPRWSAIAVLVQPPIFAEGTGQEAVEHLKEAANKAIVAHAEESAVNR